MTIISSSTIFSYIMPDGVTRIAGRHAHAQVAAGQRYQFIAVEQDTGFDDFFSFRKHDEFLLKIVSSCFRSADDEFRMVG